MVCTARHRIPRREQGRFAGPHTASLITDDHFRQPSLFCHDCSHLTQLSSAFNREVFAWHVVDLVLCSARGRILRYTQKRIGAYVDPMSNGDVVQVTRGFKEGVVWLEGTTSIEMAELRC